MAGLAHSIDRKPFIANNIYVGLGSGHLGTLLQYVSTGTPQ
jgi:hypothetical protein